MAKESKAGCQRKNPHFFKVFLPGVTSEHLEVPPGFRKHMEGDLRRCSLMGPSGNLWTVELVRNQAGGLFFGVGWKEFAQDHAMEMGEFAVFIYDGDARFRVLIFDTSACEKEAAFLAFPSKSTVDMDKAKNGHKEMTEELAVDASTRITIKTSEKKGKNRKEEGGKEDPHAAGCRLQEAPPSGCSAEGSHPRAGAPNKIYSRKRRSRGMLVSQRRPVSKEEIERAQTAAKQFTSDNPFHMVTMRKSGVYLGHSMATSLCRPRTMWNIVHVWYRALPEFQRERLRAMQFGGILDSIPFSVDMGLLTALRERWDAIRGAFIMPWGYMLPTLEDVAQITWLPVVGVPVIGTTHADYSDICKEFLDIDLQGDEEDDEEYDCSLIRLSLLAEMAGVDMTERKPSWATMDQDEFTRKRKAIASNQPKEPGVAADQALRRFILFFFGRLLFPTTSDRMHLKFLPLLYDLDQLGTYAWGPAMLAHLFYCLQQNRGMQNFGGFLPFLQIWAYEHLPVRRGYRIEQPLFPFLRRWRMGTQRANSSELNNIRLAIDDLRADEVVWEPYDRSPDVERWVAHVRPMFKQAVWLICYNVVEYLNLQLVMRSLGFHQRIPTLPDRVPRLSTLIRGGTQRWGERYADQVAEWRANGTSIYPSLDLESSEEFITWYRATYLGRLYLGERSLGELHARIQHLEDALATVTAERDRLQTNIRELLHTAAQYTYRPKDGASSFKAPPPHTDDVAEELQAATRRAEERHAEVTRAMEKVKEQLMRETERANAEATRAATAEQLLEELKRTHLVDPSKLEKARSEANYLRGQIEVLERMASQVPELMRANATLATKAEQLEEQMERIHEKIKRKRESRASFNSIRSDELSIADLRDSHMPSVFRRMSFSRFRLEARDEDKEQLKDNEGEGGGEN